MARKLILVIELGDEADGVNPEDRELRHVDVLRYDVERALSDNTQRECDYDVVRTWDWEEDGAPGDHHSGETVEAEPYLECGFRWSGTCRGPVTDRDEHRCGKSVTAEGTDHLHVCGNCGVART